MISLPPLSKPPNMSLPDRLTFIGGGHLAQAVINGIYSSNTSWKDTCPISVTARRTEHKEQLKTSFPKAFVTINNLHPAIWGANSSNAELEPARAHVVFICTRPKEVPEVCQEIASTLETLQGLARPTVVTMCPGISVAQLQRWLPEGTPIVRSMPNLPVTCREGATALFPSDDAVSRVDLVASVLREVSPAVSVLPEESLLDVAASISG